MSLHDHDEFPHTPPDPVPDLWQENWYFVGSDPDQIAGFAVHLSRLPKENLLEVKLATFANGQIASCYRMNMLPEGLETEGLVYEPIVPFKKNRIQASLKGHLGLGPLGFVASQPGGDGEVGLDITWESPLPPADHARAMEGLVTESKHYESAGVWKGTIRAGTTEVKGQGVLVRDHSWGPRDHSIFDQAWWSPTITLDGCKFVNQCGVFLKSSAQWAGYTIYVDEFGTEVTNDYGVKVLEGDLVPGGYTATEIEFTTERTGKVILTSQTQFHLTLFYPRMSARRWINEAYSIVDWSGQRAWSTREWNGDLSDADVEVLNKPHKGE